MWPALRFFTHIFSAENVSVAALDRRCIDVRLLPPSGCDVRADLLYRYGDMHRSAISQRPSAGPAGGGFVSAWTAGGLRHVGLSQLSRIWCVPVQHRVGRKSVAL